MKSFCSKIAALIRKDVASIRCFVQDIVHTEGCVNGKRRCSDFLRVIQTRCTVNFRVSITFLYHAKTQVDASLPWTAQTVAKTLLQVLKMLHPYPEAY